MRYIIGSIIVAVLMASAPSAWAQPDAASPSPADAEQARRLFQSAEAKKQKGDELSARGKTTQAQAQYGLAARDYLDGYELSKLPLFLYNLGSIYRLRGNRKWAIRCYQAFVDTRPESEKDTIDALTFVVALKQELSDGAKEADPDASIDPTSACVLEEEAAPTGPGLSVEAQPAEPAGVQALGQSVDAPEIPSKVRKYRTAFWICAAVTVLSVGVAGTTALQADRLDRKEQGSGRNVAFASYVFTGVSLGGAVAAGYFLYKGYVQKHKPEQTPASAAVITPVISPSALGAELTLRF